jgi:hypothetical protein
MNMDGSDFVSEPKATLGLERLATEAALAAQASSTLGPGVQSETTTGEIDFSKDDVLQKMLPPTGQTKNEFFKSTTFRGPDVASILNEEFSPLDRNGNGQISLKELGQSMKDALDSGDSVRAQKLYAASQTFDIIDRFSNDEWGTENGVTKSDLSYMSSMNKLELRSGIAWGVAEGRKNLGLSGIGITQNLIGIMAGKSPAASGALLLGSVVTCAAARGVGYAEYKQQKQFMTDLYRPQE